MPPSISLPTLARNWSWSGIASVWWIGSRLFLTPLVLQQISLEGYGVWTLLFSLPASINVLDASFGQAYIKLTAEHEARGERARLSSLLGAGMALVGGLGALGLGGIWLASGWLLPWLQVPPYLLEPAANALLLICLAFVLQMSLGNVRQVLIGLQRSDLSYKTQILSSVVGFVLSVVLLQRGWGLEGLALGYLLGEASGILLARSLCQRLAPGLRLSPLLATRESLRRIVSLGARFQGLFLLSNWTTQGFRMLLSALLGPVYLGYFELGHRLLDLGDLGANTVNAPMMAAFAQIHSEQKSDRARELYRMGTRLCFVISLLSFGFLCVFTPTALAVWTGETYDLASWTVRALAVAYVSKTFTALGTAELRARGSFRLEYQYTVLNVGLRVALVAPMYWIFGYEGFVLAGGIALTTSSLWFFFRFQRAVGLEPLPVLAEVIGRPLLAVVPVAVGAVLVIERLPFSDLAVVGRWRLAGELLAWVVGFGATGLLSIWRFGLARDERGEILRRVQALLAPKLRRAEPS